MTIEIHKDLFGCIVIFVTRTSEGVGGIKNFTVRSFDVYAEEKTKIYSTAYLNNSVYICISEESYSPIVALT